MEKIYKIVAINLGSTSTKIVYYENRNCVHKENLPHAADDLQQFTTVWEQYAYRLQKIEDYLQRHGITVGNLDAVTTRGGHTQPLVGGVWRINHKMLEQSASEKYGNHVTDVGLKIAHALSAQGPCPFTVDPPTTDEFEPLSRYSGLPQLPRISSFHILNHRAVGHQYAADIGCRYEELNLIGVHMGGGISIAAHRRGKLVDANNALDGDGPFSTNRCCSVPVGGLVKLCYSGQYTYEQMRRLLNGNGGLMAYVQENDVQAVEKRAADGEAYAGEVLDAMCYQIAKEIAACAAVLSGEVNAIFLTGGIANSRRVVDTITARISFIAPVVIYPGELEMQALALRSLAALRGEEIIREMI